MKLEINLKKLISHKINPHQFLVLKALYEKDYDIIQQVLTREQIIEIRNSLTSSIFLLSDSSTKFLETIINEEAVKKLLGLDREIINFSEWYQIYPIKVGSRILRAVADSSVAYKKHEKKYLERVKTQKQHQLAIKATEAFISKQKQANKMGFLPHIETVLNNNSWETWTVFIEASGQESGTWNSTSI